MLGYCFRVLSGIRKSARFFPAGNPSILYRILGNINIRPLRYDKQDLVTKPFPEPFENENLHCTILFSGILTFLGLKKEKDEQESELILTIKKGILSKEKGDMARAEWLFHRALKLAYDESNEDGITYIYDLLANLALDAGENEKAEKLFTSVMQRLVDNGNEVTGPKVLHISLKLAKIFQRRKEYEKSELGYQYCVKHMEENMKTITEDAENYRDNMMLWVTILDNYGRFLFEQSRLREAMENFREAHKASVQVNGREHENTVLLLNDLGLVSFLMGELDSALSYIEEAVEIGNELPDVENISMIYMNLGYLYLAKEMLNEAKNACLKSLRYARRDEDNECINRAKECLKKIDLASKANTN